MDRTNFILDAVDSFKDEQLDFLVSICDQNSHTANKEGVDLVSGAICHKLGNIFPVHETSEQQDRGNHHILRTGGSGRSLYLLGHVDTVFPKEHPFQSCRREKGWLQGPGTADMKGGLAVVVYALLALHRAGSFPSFNLTLILGGDEEEGSVSSREIYIRERRNAFACLVAECGGEKGEFVISRNGKLGGRLECFGKDRHVGTVSNEKSSAILEMAHKIIALESLNSQSGVRFNAGRVQGGLGPATIPRQAVLHFDLRWQHEEQLEKIEPLLRRITERNHQPGCTSRMEVLNRRPAMPSGKTENGLIPILENISSRLDIPVLFEHRHGSSDANFFGASGVPTLDGFGPIGIRDHTSEERIRIDSLAERTKLLSLLLYLLSPERL